MLYDTQPLYVKFIAFLTTLASVAFLPAAPMDFNYCFEGGEGQCEGQSDQIAQGMDSHQSRS